MKLTKKELSNDEVQLVLQYKITRPVVISSDELENELCPVTVSRLNNRLTTLDTAQFTTGIIPLDRLPTFEGNVSIVNGKTFLTGSGVFSGEYTKVFVNNLGQVSMGLPLTSTDLPNLDWGVFGELPTTLNGYGIVNGLSVNGGTFTGRLKISNVPNAGAPLLNLTTLNTIIETSKVPVGSTILKVEGSDSSGYLRCNGGIVGKDLYSNLYNAIGDVYGVFDVKGNGMPWVSQYNLNTVPSGGISGWSGGTKLPSDRFGGEVVITKNKAYYMGGVTSSFLSRPTVNTIYVSNINEDGTLGNWSLYGTLPVNLDSFNTLAYNNKLYIIGTGSTGNSSVIYRYDITSNGDLINLTNIGNTPYSFSNGGALIHNGYLYILGGISSGGTTNLTYYAKINDNGTLGNWVRLINLPSRLARFGCVVIGSYVYILGGARNNNGTTDVYRSLINPNGTLSNWVYHSGLPNRLRDACFVSTGNRLYVLGGRTGVLLQLTTDSVNSCSINPDGSLGGWRSEGNLPLASDQGKVFVTKNRLHYLGGNNNIGIIDRVFTCSFNGGFNDYSEYYGVENKYTFNDTFRLPTIDSLSTDLSFFIKY